MAHPKRKSSKARRSQRRAVYYNRLKAPQMMECPSCGTIKMMHRACPTCGTYRGRQVIERSESI